MILATYLRNKLLDHLLKNTAYTKPALYFTLFTAGPLPDGTEGTEVTIGAGAFARKLITNDNASFPQCAATGAPTKSNGIAIVFPTASASWGTITHWGVYDASTAGNLLAYGQLATTRTVVSGDSPKFSAGALAITATNITAGGLTTYSQRKLLDHVFGGPAYVPVATLYTGLGTALSSETMAEWEEDNYARQATAFDSASAGLSKNAAEEIYCADVDSGAATLTHIGVFDDVTTGNLLVVGTLATSRTVANDDSVTLPDEVFTVTLQ